jgi:hypothetical protein
MDPFGQVIYQPRTALILQNQRRERVGYHWHRSPTWRWLKINKQVLRTDGCSRSDHLTLDAVGLADVLGECGDDGLFDASVQAV